MKYSFLQLGIFALILTVCAFVPELAQASVESSLNNIQTKFVGVILPAMAVIGLLLAGVSFAMGSQNARSHLFLAIMGSIVGFGSQSIVDFIKSMVS